MFQIAINAVSVLFSKFFTAADAATILKAIPSSARKVLFVDTGATPHLAATVRSLVERGVDVYIRDHHAGEGRNPESADVVEEILGSNARIVDRETAPGCATMVGLGEFSSADTVIIADPDYDGLVAAMKAAGVTYEGMEGDAEIFDVRPEQSAETLTELGWTAVRALATLPPFDKGRPEVSENAKRDLFAAFIGAVSGDAEAREGLERRVAVYEAGVTEAERLLSEKVTQPCNGLALVDSVGAGRPDLTTLTRGMEAEGVKVTVLRKDFGPIAGEPGGHGVQYSLAVVRQYQGEIDLRDLVPEGTETSPQSGILSNVPFLLHCSEGIWSGMILPALESRLA